MFLGIKIKVVRRIFMNAFKMRGKREGDKEKGKRAEKSMKLSENGSVVAECTRRK